MGEVEGAQRDVVGSSVACAVDPHHLGRKSYAGVSHN